MWGTTKLNHHQGKFLNRINKEAHQKMFKLQKIPLAWSLSLGTESSSLESALQRLQPPLSPFSGTPKSASGNICRSSLMNAFFLLNLCNVASGKFAKTVSQWLLCLQVFSFTEYRSWGQWPLSHEEERARGLCVPSSSLCILGRKQYCFIIPSLY